MRKLIFALLAVALFAVSANAQLYPRRGEDIYALSDIPIGPNSNVYYVDPANGSDTNTGLSHKSPLASVEAAYAKCTTNQNDCVLMIGGPTADNPADTITWAKSYTHLIGLSGDLPGMGQRCRIVCTTDPDETQVMTVSGSGCIFRNIQFYNGTDADADSGAVSVTGSRNVFDRCFFAGMAHATPAARAGSYSLDVSGSENVFKDCNVGLDTVIRAAANGELVVSGGARNKFIHCDFRSYSETTGKFMVIVQPLVDRDVQFDDCLFYNFATNWGAHPADAFNVNAITTHYVILRGLNQLVGIDGWADTTTHIYMILPQQNTGAGVSINPAW